VRLCTSPQKLEAGDVAPTLPEFGELLSVPVPVPVADPVGGPALRSACAPSPPALLISLVGVELGSGTSCVVSPKGDADGGGGDNNGITPFSSLFSEASRGLSLDEHIEEEDEGGEEGARCAVPTTGASESRGGERERALPAAPLEAAESAPAPGGGLSAL